MVNKVTCSKSLGTFIYSPLYLCLCNQLPLTITSTDKTTTVLYGLGPIAEKTNEWNYVLNDGMYPSTGSGQAWHYEYDANGSLVEVLPNGDEASGAKRYTYNAAGYLMQVESHDGSSWNTQAEMTYNGLGSRLTSSALGVTTQYASDGQMPLTISSGGKTTTVLYGLGPIAENTDVWNYVLNDGVNLPRQLTDMDGKITLFVRYNPWGKPIETSGTGNFDASYIGTLIDATTGLIYVANGQYYDSETERFLTRDSKPNQPNPCVHDSMSSQNNPSIRIIPKNGVTSDDNLIN